MVNPVLLGSVALLGLCAAMTFSQAPPPKSGYASVNGLNMYYEIHGTGAPLVLIHGG